MQRQLGKAQFKQVWRLRCPYCATTPLRKEGGWFSFRRGCQTCNYRYEREAGYFTGSSWMIAFPLVAVLGLLSSACLLWLVSGVNTLAMVGMVSVVMLVFGAVICPFCMALWLVIDHRLHPLEADEVYDAEP